jgi:hypothetical protein
MLHSLRYKILRLFITCSESVFLIYKTSTLYITRKNGKVTPLQARLWPRRG